MRTAKQYTDVIRLNLRSEVRYCPFCQRFLRRVATLNQRHIVTLHQVIFLTHCGYRCPQEGCPGSQVMYRSTQADTLALPGFTFGLDVLMLAGTLRLGEHRTLDEVHWALLERLGPRQISISRREVGYLIETYAAFATTVLARWPRMKRGKNKGARKAACFFPLMAFNPIRGIPRSTWCVKSRADGSSWQSRYATARPKPSNVCCPQFKPCRWPCVGW